MKKKVDVRLVVLLVLGVIFMLSAVESYSAEKPLTTPVSNDFVDFDYGDVFRVLEIDPIPACPEQPSLPYQNQGF